MFSLYDMMKAYHDNQAVIQAYLQSKSIEGYQPFTAVPLGNTSTTRSLSSSLQSDAPQPSYQTEPTQPTQTQNNQKQKILGLEIGIFITIMGIFLFTWIIALVVFVMNWSKLTNTVKVISVLLLLGILGPISPIVAITIILLTKQV